MPGQWPVICRLKHKHCLNIHTEKGPRFMVDYLDMTSYRHIAGHPKFDLGGSAFYSPRPARPRDGGGRRLQDRGWWDAGTTVSPLGLPWKVWLRSTDVKAHDCPRGPTFSWGRDDGEHVPHHPSCRRPSEKAVGWAEPERVTHTGLTALCVCKHV